MKITDEYIVGLIDGEGTISTVKYEEGRIRPQVLIFNTNRKVLEMVKKHLLIKAPIIEVKRVADKFNRKKICYRLQIRSKQDLNKVFKIFEKQSPIIKEKKYRKIKNMFKSWLIPECPSGS